MALGKRAVAQRLVHRGVVDVVDDEGLDRAAGALDLEAEVVHQVQDLVDQLIFRINGEVEVPRAGDAGLVEDRKVEITTQSYREVVRGGVASRQLDRAFLVTSHKDNGARVGIRILGSDQLERPSATGEDVDFAFFRLKVALEAKAFAQERLKHLALLGGGIGIVDSDVVRGRAIGWDGVDLEAFRAAPVGAACDLVVLQAIGVLDEHPCRPAEENATAGLSVEALRVGVAAGAAGVVRLDGGGVEPDGNLRRYGGLRGEIGRPSDRCCEGERNGGG
jgi:hypothetical protein